MKDYSIENSIGEIHSEKTKEYFKEVASSYYNDNFRASIVTLYSVVINDILIKLEILDEIYADKTANAILQDIRKSQKEHPNNPDWEKNIIEEVKNRTSLIDNVDYTHIQALKNDRHLSAHPVVDKDDKLYTPNKETAAAHIRNMLEALFLKPPILSKKILSSLLIDIAEKKEILIDRKSFETYIISKYLKNLNASVEVSMFRDLWKFVFNLENDDANANRITNFRLLRLIYNRNAGLCIQKIKVEQEYFSNVSNNGVILLILIRFFSENEFLIREFREDVLLLISKRTEKDPSAKTLAWFLSDNYAKHLLQVKSWVRSQFDGSDIGDALPQAYQRLIEIGFVKGYKEETIDFIVWRYENTHNFNDGDKVFSYLVSPNLNEFNEKHLIQLCEKTNKNNQACGRKRAAEDHEQLKKYIEIKVEKFDFANYENIFQT